MSQSWRGEIAAPGAFPEFVFVRFQTAIVHTNPDSEVPLDKLFQITFQRLAAPFGPFLESTVPSGLGDEW